MRVAGFVLVGGHSSRMGRDKGLLSWHSRPLVTQIAARVASVTGNVTLVGDPARYAQLGLDCIPDLRPDCGPLGGIEAAVASGRGELNLIVACDMPDLDTTLLSDLLRKAEQSDADCVAARDSTSTVHPLCAVYRSRCLKIVQTALDDEQLKLRNVLKQLNTVFLNAPCEIWNVNTPEEWRARQSQ